MDPSPSFLPRGPSSLALAVEVQGHRVACFLLQVSVVGIALEMDLSRLSSTVVYNLVDLPSHRPSQCRLRVPALDEERHVKCFTHAHDAADAQPHHCHPHYLLGQISSVSVG